MRLASTCCQWIVLFARGVSARKNPQYAARTHESNDLWGQLGAKPLDMRQTVPTTVTLPTSKYLKTKEGLMGLQSANTPL